jgi:hypothetical protein
MNIIVSIHILLTIQVQTKITHIISHKDVIP